MCWRIIFTICIYLFNYKNGIQWIFAEEEKEVGFESQQFESNFAVSRSSEVDLAQDATSKVDEQSIQDSSNNTSIKLTSGPEAPSNEANAMKMSATKVLVTDLECDVCKQLLYRPIVLNCGHGKSFLLAYEEK